MLDNFEPRVKVWSHTEYQLRQAAVGVQHRALGLHQGRPQAFGRQPRALTAARHETTPSLLLDTFGPGRVPPRPQGSGPGSGRPPPRGRLTLSGRKTIDRPCQPAQLRSHGGLLRNEMPIRLPAALRRTRRVDARHARRLPYRQDAGADDLDRLGWQAVSDVLASKRTAPSASG